MLADRLGRLLRRLRARRLARPAYVALGRYGAAVTRDGHRIHLLADDLSLTPTVALTGVWEPHVASLLRRLLRPGMLVAEGGANVGCHTLVMAEAIGPAGRLHAFEPVPDFPPLLERTLAANRLAARVVLHERALLDRVRPIELLLDPTMLGSGHLAMVHASTRYSRRVAAQATTLDAALAAEGDRPLDLLRLDIEGSEALALHGAEATIRRSPRLRIVMEWSPPMLAARCDPAAEAAWLAGLGFRFWRIGRHGWRGHALHPVPAASLADLPHGELLASRDPP
jgi:FkbM family methyltransferase